MPGLDKKKIEDTKKVNAMVQAIESHAWKITALIRFSPLPWGIQNATLAVSTISFVAYFLISFACCIAEVIVWVTVGETVRNISEIVSGNYKLGPAEIVLLVIQIVVAITFVVVIIVLGRRAWKKFESEQEDIQPEDEKLDPISTNETAILLDKSDSVSNTNNTYSSIKTTI